MYCGSRVFKLTGALFVLPDRLEADQVIGGSNSFIVGSCRSAVATCCRGSSEGAGLSAGVFFDCRRDSFGPMGLSSKNGELFCAIIACALDGRVGASLGTGVARVSFG